MKNRPCKYPRRYIVFAVAASIFFVVLLGVTPFANAQTVGAPVPFTEFNAVTSSGVATNGTVIGPSYYFGDLAAEATGRQAVLLSGQGKFVSFTLTAPANAITVHYAIPDAPAGGGITEPLSLYANGTFATSLSLTSAYSWLYGEYTFSKTPSLGMPGALAPHDFYNDVRYMFSSTLPVGTVVKLQVDTGDNSPWYIINTADFEVVPAAIPAPPNSINVTQAPYSADNTGVRDATTALQNAINAAETSGQIVYLPSGTYTISSPLAVNNVTVEGAGEWYTVITGKEVEFAGNIGPASTNVNISNLAIFGNVAVRVDSDGTVNGFNGGFSNSTISNVWIQNTKVGAWIVGPATGLTLNNLRIMDLKADGINFNAANGAMSNDTIENTFFRNTQDDGMALWAENASETGIVMNQNTVLSPGLANNIAIYGPANPTITNNLLEDPVTRGSCIHDGTRFGTSTTLGPVIIQNNQLERCGQYDPGFYFGVGAIWFWPLDANMSTAVNLSGNSIQNSPYSAYMFLGPSSTTDVNINGDTVTNVGTFVVHTQGNGAVSVTNTPATGIAATGGGYLNLGCTWAFTLTATGDTGWTSTPICNFPAGNPLWVYPDVVTFQTTQGSPLTQQVVVINAAYQTTTLGAISASSGFTVSQDSSQPCGSSIVAAEYGGASEPGWCYIDVTFNGAGAGITTGTLTIPNSAGNATVVQLVGSTGGNTQNPQPQVAPTSLTFASQLVGTTSAPQSVTLTNPAGAAPLGIGSVTLPSGFTQTNTCGSSLVAGAACTISVTFAPTSAGTLSGNLVIATSLSSITVALSGSASAPPSIPTGLLAAPSGNGAVTVSWTASTGSAPITYNVYRGLTSGGEGSTPVATDITTLSYTDTGLTNGTAYYYEVSATNAVATSGKSAEVAASPAAPLLQIDAGGAGAAPFVADEDFSTGNEFSTGSTVSLAGVGSPAPEAVYQTVRWAPSFTYTIPSLTPGSTYTVRLHFAELSWTAAGQRVFNVAINGAPVLTNFDIVATAGALQALIKQFAATANSSGQIVISFTQGTADNPEIAGIEILGSSSISTPPVAPSVPTGLAATPGTSSISLLWSASTGTAPIMYNVYRSTASGGETLLASSITTTSYTDSSVVSGTTYFYEVSATNSVASSNKSTEVSATISPTGTAPSIPANLVATPGTSSISLSWSASTGTAPITYNIYRSTTSGGETLLASGITTTGYTDSSVVSGTTYFYEVSASNAVATSGKSTEVSATAGPSSTRMVFAHYMLTNQDYQGDTDPTGQLKVLAYEKEIQQAQAAGINGFALNAGSWLSSGTTMEYYIAYASQMFQAAVNLNSGFKLFFSIDFCCGNQIADAEDAMRRFANDPVFSQVYFKYNGKFVLSTFSGDELGTAAWQQIRSDLANGTNPSTQSVDIALWPTIEVGGPPSNAPLQVEIVPAFIGAFGGEVPTEAEVQSGFNTWSPYIDGALYWGIAGVPGSGGSLDQVISSEAYASVLHAGGKLYMAPVCLQFWGSDADRYFEYSGYSGMRKMWMDAINVSHPDWVEIITWNDFIEGSYVSPIDDPNNPNYAFANFLTGSGLPTQPGQVGYFHSHIGATALLPYFIQWYKTGVQPSINNDSIYWAYRTQSVNDQAASNIPAVTAATNFGPMADEIYVTANLAQPGILTVTSGSKVTSFTLTSGSTDVQAPFVDGNTPSFTFTPTGSSAPELSGSGTDPIGIYTYLPASGTAIQYNDEYYSTGDLVGAPLSTKPQAPTLSPAIAGNASVTLNWSASFGSTPITYNVYRGTSSGGEGSSPIATGLSVLTYTDSTAVNGTTYYYVVRGVNSFGTSPNSNEVSATPAAPTLPSIPQLQTPTGGEGTISLSWSASTGTAPITYTVYRGTVSGAEVQIATGIATTSYADTDLANNTTYYYVVSATNLAGTSIKSNEVSAATLNVLLQIDAGGSGVAPYAADEDFNTGNEFSTGSTVSTTGVVSPAPEAVYQTVRWASSFTYTIPGLSAGNSYTVRLHFAELTWTAAGQRVFNVAINGTSVLSNFDIFATAGGQLKALIKQFTATANSSGQIVISFTQGTADNPEVAGIEILSNSVSTPTAPSTPAGVTATAGNASVTLSWSASTGTAPITYSVYRGTSSGGEGATPIATGISATTYTDSGVANGTTYYYKVAASNAAGTSAESSEASATPVPTGTLPSVPSGLKAAAGNASVALSWSASTGTTPITYSVYRGTASGSESSTPVVTGISATSYTDTGLSDGTTYYYEVSATNSIGTSAKSSEVTATPVNNGGGSNTLLQIDAGGGAVGTFVADEDFNNGNEYSTGTAVNTTGVVNAAPAAVYQSIRWAPSFTYIIPGFTAGSSYTVRLHFAELTWTAPGQRVFNVAINGTTVLSNFDIFATAGEFNAVVEQFTTTADSLGQVTISFTRGSADNPEVAGIEILGSGNIGSQLSDVVEIDAGSSSAVSPFVADEDFNTGNEFSSGAVIDTSHTSTPAPAAVYQSARWNSSFTYTIPGLTAGKPYAVRLHFAELTWTASGQRLFNVAINGTTVLNAFDIFATTGAQNRAVTEQFTATANSSGQIVISFTQAGADNPEVNGVEILH